jgi:group I intron endonuclease
LKSDWIEYGLKTTDSGVYLIKNIINGKVYVGSATRLIERLSNHFHSLRNNKHHSIHLQNSWNLNNGYFVCGVIEFIDDKNQLKIVEQKYIDKYNAANDKFGYNICPIARNNLGCKQKRGLEERSRRMTGSGNHFYNKNHSISAKYFIGLNNYCRKLENSQIIEIKRMWQLENKTQAEIAKIFNISAPYVSRIINNKRRKLDDYVPTPC